jgi:hypothetical protein
MRASIALACAAAALASAACGARLPSRPESPGSAYPLAIEEFTRATRRCTGLQTMTASLRLSGRVSGERLRGTLHAGLASPAAVRVEAVAPFGQPAFILAGRDNRATLLFPRDDRVIRDAPLPELLERLAGLRLGAADLRLLLTACLADPADPRDGRMYTSGWRSVVVGDETTAYLDEVRGELVVVAADAGPWRIDYANFLNGWPRSVRLRTATGEVDMTASIEQLAINTPLDERAFEVDVPAGAVAISLDDLRSIAPLRTPPEG